MPRIWEHPDFERVAEGFREAIRRKDDADIERWRGELRRLVLDKAVDRVVEDAADEAFTVKPKRRRRSKPRPDDPDGGTAIIIDADTLAGPIEFAVVAEPYIYRRRTLGPTRKQKRYLLNVFVPGLGPRVLETNATTFAALAALKDEIDFERQLVCLERNAEPVQGETHAVSAAGPIPKRLANRVHDASSIDLAEVAEQLIAKNTNDLGGSNDRS